MISACILTRNSQRTIRQCIEAILPAVDEVIVVDTGSHDDTIPIVQSLGIEPHHFEWVDSFSAARNYAHSCASNDWIIAVDSDEILTPDDADKIRLAVSSDEQTIFGVTVINEGANGEMGRQSQTARIYNHKHVSWMHRAHEQLVMNGQRLQPIPTDVHFAHDGYNSQVTSTYDKSLRNVKLLRLDVQDNPYAWDRHFYLGRDALSIANTEESIEHLNIAVQLLESSGEYTFFPSVYRSLAMAYEASARFDDAQSVTQKMMELFPSYPEGHYMYSRLVIRHIEKLLKDGKFAMERAKHLAQSYSGTEVTDETIATWKGDMTLGDLAKLRGDLATARRMYQSALESGGPTKPLSDAIGHINRMLRSM